MGVGITIILIAAVGVGYYLYQKFSPGNRRRAMTEVRTGVSEILNRILTRRDHDENIRGQYQETPVQIQSVPIQTPPPARQTNNRPLVPASRENITETGQMIYFANDRHGQSDKEYRFNYKKVGNGWRAYILRMPSIGSRNDGSGVIHRLHDDGGYYICWDRQVNSLKDMQIISRRWADSIQEYIATGRFG